MADMLKKKAIKDFEAMLDLSAARALSRTSLERPLTDDELKKFRKLVRG